MEPRPFPLIAAIIILLIAAGGLWYVLTRPTTAPLPDDQTATSTETGAVKQTINDSGQYYDVTVTYPSKTPLAASAGATADAKAVTIMKSFVTQEVANFKENNITTLTPEDIQVMGLGGDRKYALGADYTLYTSPTTVSYVYLLYQDTMGAHPNSYYRTFVFNSKTGEGLTLADIFSPTTDYASVLSNQARTRLPAILQQKTGSTPDADMLAAGTSADADNFQNFYLSEKNLVIIFPPYQIAAYAVGTTELSLPLADLGNAIRAEYR